MKISTNTSFAGKLPLTVDERIAIVKEAGFDCYDLSFFTPAILEEFKEDVDYREHARKIRAYADSIGIECNQAHAPFNGIYGVPDSELGFSALVRCMEVSSLLGAKIIVIHPLQHLNYAENAARLYEMNLIFYRKLLPYAERFGIKIATENMWQCNCGANVPTDSVCSRSSEFCRLVDELNSPYLVGCLDIGHVSLMGADIPAFIRAMGQKRLQALHVHDTDFIHDDHTLPYLRRIDFSAVTKALGEIDYQGELTFEAANFFARFPRELYLPAARLMCETGRYLAREIDKSRPIV